MHSSVHHVLGQHAGYKVSHILVDDPCFHNQTGVDVVGPCPVNQVVGVHADTVSAHQSGTHVQEVPFGGGAIQYFGRADAHGAEDGAQLVHQGDVHVALGVLHHLCGFGHTDGRGTAGAVGQHRTVQLLHEVEGIRRGAGNYLGDVFHGMFFVAGIDALGRVAHEVVRVEGQSGAVAEHRHADLLGTARKDRGFVDYDVALLEQSAHRGAGHPQRGEVGIVGIIHRRGHTDDVHIAVAQVLRIGGQVQIALQAVRQGGSVHLAGIVLGTQQIIHPFMVDFQAVHAIALGKQAGQRQSYVAQSYNPDSDILYIHNVL